MSPAVNSSTKHNLAREPALQAMADLQAELARFEAEVGASGGFSEPPPQQVLKAMTLSQFTFGVMR